VLRVGRVVVLLAMDDKTMYTTFKWCSTDPKLAKAVKARMGDLMREASSYHKTAVLWHEVQFVESGIVVPFKKASSKRTTWAWFYRYLTPLILKMKGSRKDWKWEAIEVPPAVESEVATHGVSTSPQDPEQKPSGEASSSSHRVPPIADGRGLELFPPSVALKVSRGTTEVIICGVEGLDRVCCMQGLVMGLRTTAREAVLHHTGRQTTYGMMCVVGFVFCPSGVPEVGHGPELRSSHPFMFVEPW
jgi:hypothetical protein